MVGVDFLGICFLFNPALRVVELKHLLYLIKIAVYSASITTTFVKFLGKISSLIFFNRIWQIFFILSRSLFCIDVKPDNLNNFLLVVFILFNLKFAIV